jgi:hypothetical protein
LKKSWVRYSRQNTTDNKQNTIYNIRNTKYKIRNTKYEIQNTKYKIRNTKKTGLRPVFLDLSQKILSEKPNEKHGEQKAQDGADDDFADAMAGALLEAGIFVGVDVELFNEHIKITSLVAKVHSKTGRIIDDQKGQRDGDCERT